jgi:hypothetical protein
MKKNFLLIILILVGAGYGGYYLFQKVNQTTVDVSGKIQVSQASNYEASLASSVSSSFDAVVKGTAKNNTSKPLKNVFIKFDIAGEQTSATIFDIAPGQSIEFTTKSVRTDTKNPVFSLDDVLYDETTM